MNIAILIVLCVQVHWVVSAPLQLQLYNPYQNILMPQQNLQQILGIQSMQFNPLASMAMNNQQPMLIFLPDDQTIVNSGIDKIDNGSENKLKSNDPQKSKGDMDSVVIEAEPQPVLEDQKAILVLPSGRFSIGDFISSIPFLPIEINVPDTISWAYDGIASGISGIISIIGQRLPGPFKRPPTEATMPANLRTVISNIQMNKRQSILRPIVMMPLGDMTRPIIPMQV